MGNGSCERRITPIKTIIMIFIVLFMFGCVKENTSDVEVIARVGERILTADEVNAWEASLRGTDVPQDARSAYIRRWVEVEILYREARNNNLTNDAWVIQRLDEVTRDLLVSRLLEIEYGKLQQPSPASAQSYFQQNSSEFVWAHEHLVVEYWRADERHGMEILRSNVQRGRQSGLWTGRTGSLENSRIALDGPWSAAPEVWRVVSRMKTGQVSQVTKINGSYWVFKLIDRREEGDPQGIEDVMDDIVARLIEESRRQLREEIVRGLMDRYRRDGELEWSIQPPTVAVSDTAEH